MRFASTCLLAALLVLPPSISEAKGFRKWAWAPAAVGVASTWASGWLYLDARSRYAKLREGPDSFSPAQADAFQAAGTREQSFAAAALGLGVVGLSAGVALYLLGDDEAQLTAAIGPNGAAASLRWTFP